MKIVLAARIAFAFVAVATTSRAYSTGVVVETVSDYDWWCPQVNECCANGCDTVCNADGDGLWYALTAPGTGWTGTHHYFDSNVWDTDFLDPELTGNPVDNDTWNFDQYGVAISHTCAHGRCDDRLPTVCNYDWDCPAGSWCPGMPPLNPYESRGCIQEKVRQLVTASTTNHHGNEVRYGRNYNSRWPTKAFALGESSLAGPFGGAGTNGDTNVAFIVNSCGLRSRVFWGGTSYFYAGVHAVMMAMPTAAWYSIYDGWCASDTGSDPSRGAKIADAILTNPDSATIDAWLNPSQLTYVDSCASNHPWGANIIMSRDSTQLKADIHVCCESWNNAHRDDLDATGNGYGQWTALCNYDCATYGW